MGLRGPAGTASGAVAYPDGRPKPSYGMTQRAKRFFERYADIMEAAGNLQVVDGTLLSMFCILEDRWLTNYSRLKREGDMLSGARGKKYKNPRVDIWLKQGVQVSAFAAKLGFSPADRERIKARGKKGKSALEKFMEENGG